MMMIIVVQTKPMPQCAVEPSLRILKKPDSPQSSPQEFFTLETLAEPFIHKLIEWFINWLNERNSFWRSFCGFGNLLSYNWLAIESVDWCYTRKRFKRRRRKSETFSGRWLFACPLKINQQTCKFFSLSSFLELSLTSHFPEGQSTCIVNTEAYNDHRVGEGPEILFKLREDNFNRLLGSYMHMLLPFDGASW